MLQTDGIAPRLSNQVCEALLCQQYCYRGEIQQEVDVLLIKVNGRWHQLYFDSGIVFWHFQEEEPKAVEAQPGDPITYPLIDLGEKYALEQSVISECITEPLLDGAQVTFEFEDKGALIVKHTNNKTALHFLSNQLRS